MRGGDAGPRKGWIRIGGIGGCVVAVLLLSGLTAAPVALDGRVVNRASNRPVAGAIIALPISGLRTSTDEQGRFSFGGEEALDGDTLVITHPDFLPVRIPLGFPTDSAWTVTVRAIPYGITVDGRSDPEGGGVPE